MFVSLCVVLSEFFVIFLYDVIYLLNHSYTKVHLIYSFILCYFNNRIFFSSFAAVFIGPSANVFSL